MRLFSRNACDRTAEAARDRVGRGVDRGRELHDRRRGTARSPIARPQGRVVAPLRNTQAGTLFNERLAEDGQTVFASACRPGVEGIVSKRVDGTYRSGRCAAWIKVRNPACIAEQRERSENWNRRWGLAVSTRNSGLVGTAPLRPALACCLKLAQASCNPGGSCEC